MKSMNRGLNLPQIQRIMNDFERESATMDMKEEMMSDAVDDVMDDDLEDEEEEGDKILKQVLDEIGVGISQQVRVCSLAGPPPALASSTHIIAHVLLYTACRRADRSGYLLDVDGASTRCPC
jgi:division protein CdvB (Snf7/Vps24/ESCRT-III family)